MDEQRFVVESVCFGGRYVLLEGLKELVSAFPLIFVLAIRVFKNIVLRFEEEIDA